MKIVFIYKNTILCLIILILFSSSNFILQKWETWTFSRETNRGEWGYLTPERAGLTGKIPRTKRERPMICMRIAATVNRVNLVHVSEEDILALRCVLWLSFPRRRRRWRAPNATLADPIYNFQVSTSVVFSPHFFLNIWW